MNLKYGIIGTGALGGYFGGKLAYSGCDVHFLFHSDYSFVKENGLRVDSVGGDFHLSSVNAYYTTSDMSVCDVVFVCLKTTENHLLVDLLPPLLHENTLVILLQNGIGVEAQLAKQFPNLSIAGALAFICSAKIAPGHISHTDQGKINAASYNCPDLSLLEQIKADFTKAEVPFDIVPDLNKARWQKLVWNIPYNGLSVILNTTTDKMQQNTSSRALLYDVMLEVIQAANACGASIAESLADKMLELTDRMPPYAPSMKLDFDNKRSMEIASIYSNAIAIAKEHNFHMRKVEVLEQQLYFIQGQYLV